MGREHEGQESGLLGDGTAVEGHLAPALLEATRVTLGAALLQLVLRLNARLPLPLPLLVTKTMNVWRSQ